MPNPQPHESVREASIRWVLSQIRKLRPHTVAPRELAGRLVLIAEQHHVAIEELVEWLNQQKPYESITARRFADWCEAAHIVRQMQRKQEKP